MSTRQPSHSYLHSWVILLIVLVMIRPGACEEETAVKETLPIAIIPAPVLVERREGAFVIRGPFSADVDRSARAPVRLLRHLGPWMAVPGNVIRMNLTGKGVPERLGDEGYVLDVAPGGITLRARAPAGFFHGIQTLRQLLPPEAEKGAPTPEKAWRVPAVHIEDRPRFSWRGMHLDVCRHFIPVEDVKRFLDLLALLKFNSFHWHLTEDQGWRIEIKKYPRLVEVGARRDESPKPGARTEGDGTPYGGYYTQDEIREVVAYAAERFITIVPEIEMPGHAQAAIAAYPELGNTGEPLAVRTRWGVSRHVYNVEEETFTFLENVLTEVMDLFPGTFIHIGGDECPKHEWKASAKAQARIEAEGLKDEHELQSWFIRRIEKFLQAHDRRLIGWDEIQEGGLAPNAAMMVWRSVKYGIDAARQGHDVVMSPTSHCYFDYYQGDPKHEPEAIGGLLPLERVYGFEPVPPGLTEAEAAHVLGAQGNLWTEYMPDFGQVTYMAFPRAAALAEVVWSPAASRDFDAFRTRWRHVSRRLDAMGVRHRIEPPRPIVDAVIFQERAQVEFHGPGGDAEIRYTLDGTVPDASSPLYVGTIRADRSCVVTAATFTRERRWSAPVRVDVIRYDPVETPDLEPGLRVHGYTGDFTRVPDFDTLESRWTEDVDGFAFTGREPDNGFALRYEGYLAVDQPGIYVLRLGSDDGSVLRIAGARIVDNDGLHGYVVRQGRILLRKGIYPFELAYFERGGAERLTVELHEHLRLLRPVETAGDR